MHLGPFGWLTKLDAKRAELMQKFVPRSRVRIFRNERTRSTTLDPKLMFWCVSYYLGPFFAQQHSVQNRSTGAKVCATKSRWNFSLWTHPIHTKGPKTHVFLHFVIVWVHLGLFRYCNKLDAKWAELVQLMQKFMSRSHVVNFHNQHTWYTPLDSKLMFCCVS